MLQRQTAWRISWVVFTQLSDSEIYNNVATNTNVEEYQCQQCKCRTTNTTPSTAAESDARELALSQLYVHVQSQMLFYYRRVTNCAHHHAKTF